MREQVELSLGRKVSQKALVKPPDTVFTDSTNGVRLPLEVIRFSDSGWHHLLVEIPGLCLQALPSVRLVFETLRSVALLTERKVILLSLSISLGWRSFT